MKHTPRKCDKNSAEKGETWFKLGSQIVWILGTKSEEREGTGQRQKTRVEGKEFGMR